MTESLHVLELGGGISAAYAAKLLGDHGADVVKVEPPEGDATRYRGPFIDDVVDPEGSGLFRALNLNKRGISLDLDTDDGYRELQRLLNWADILVHGFSRQRALKLGLDHESICSLRPDLVVLSITPFGITGPYCDYVAQELTLAHAGGWANYCPGGESDPALAPLKPFGSQCGLMAGIAGAFTALAVWRDCRRTGDGEYIDLSEQAYVAGCLEGAIPFFSYPGIVSSRADERMLTPWCIFQAQDGPIFIVCIEQDQWLRLVELMGNPEWAQLEIFHEQEARAENQDMVHAMVQEFVSEWKVMDLYLAAQQRRICVAPVMDMAQFAASPQLRSRGFFIPRDQSSNRTLEYLAPAVISSTGREPIRLSAPRLGEHNEAVSADLAADASRQGSARNALEGQGTPTRLPLEGIRVLDLSWAWAGPFASLNLAHLGAEVIRIESEQRLDLYRRLPILPEDMEPGVNRVGMFNQWNQGKDSITVDLRQPRGLDIVKELVKDADVVVQNLATGALDRMGLGYDVLKALNPRIILASISGYGQTGPERHYMGYGPGVSALTGLCRFTGYIDGGPEEIGLSMPDPTAGITAAFAVVSALAKRDQTGSGEHLDVSLWEATGAFEFEAWMPYAMNGTQPQRMGNRDTNMAPHGCFACEGENNWISIACTDEVSWLKLCEFIDPALVEDARFRSLADRKTNESALEEIITRWTQNQDRWDLTRRLQAQGIAAFPTLNAKDLVEDPHLNERGFIERLEHPEVGVRAHTGIPWRLQRRPNGVRSPAPCLGADTDRVLKDILGYDAERIAELRAQQVLR